jgi:hypothetical protein
MAKDEEVLVQRLVDVITNTKWSLIDVDPELAAKINEIQIIALTLKSRVEEENRK